MDLPILKYVDILIGFSLVMLLVATVALSISQALLNMWAARARHLIVGLEQLIRQVHPQLLGPHATEMANQVLLHPMVQQPRSAPMRWLCAVWNGVISLLPAKAASWLTALPVTTGAVILREELAICLLEWASEDGAWTMTVTPDADPAKVRARREALTAALKQRGIEDPSGTLKAFRLQAMTNEQEHPEQTAQLWRSQALAQTASSDFLAGLFQSFDTTMTRASANFGVEAQLWVSIVALVIVFAVQLDSFALVQRLSVDDRYRDGLVAAAKQLESVDTAGDANRQTDIKAAKAGVIDQITASLKVLQSPVYDLGSKWGPNLWPSQDYIKAIPGKLPGMFVAWLLVSLGAPFWFDMIKNLFQLRSLIAQKDAADRTERNAASTSTNTATTATTTAPTNTTPSTTTTSPGNNGAGVLDPADGLGEMGDLAATGAHG